MRNYLLSGYLFGVMLGIGHAFRLNFAMYETWEIIVGGTAAALFIGGPIGALIAWPLGWYLSRRHPGQPTDQRAKLPPV